MINERNNLQEVTGLTGHQYHSIFQNSPTVDWATPGLKITRLRLLSDPGFPLWDVSYCHGFLDNQPVFVSLPFDQLRKPVGKSLINELNAAGLNGKRLGIWDAISYLS